MKILSIAPYKFLPPKMGGEKGIALFNKFFCQFVDFTCVTASTNSIDDVPYTVLPLLGKSRFRYINPLIFFTLRKLIKKQQITHVILEHPYYGWLGWLLKKACGTKIIVHSHNIESLRFKTLKKWWWPIMAFYEKWVHRMAHFNFFISDEDRTYAQKTFKLNSLRCTTITYGIEWPVIPDVAEKRRCRNEILRLYRLPSDTRIFLFNGALQYKPNLEAVKTIIDIINPILLEGNLSYKIIICGKNLPAYMNELREYYDKNIVYAGFVEDISLYFKGADTFINAVIEGGGIKTKLVEALGYNMEVVTTESGGIGVPLAVTGTKMKIISDYDWKQFAGAMKSSLSTRDTPVEFFNHFYWENIAAKAYQFIQS